MGHEINEKLENFRNIVIEKDLSSREKILFALYEFGRIKRKIFVDNEKQLPYCLTKNTFDRHIRKLIEEQSVKLEYERQDHMYSITESGITKLKKILENLDLDTYIMDMEKKKLNDLIEEKSEFIKKYIFDDEVILEFLELASIIKTSRVKIHDLKPKLDFLVLYLAVNHPKLYPSHSISEEDFTKKYNLKRWEIESFLDKFIEKGIHNLSFFKISLIENDINLFFMKNSQYGTIFGSTINYHLKNFIYLIFLEKIEYDLESHRQVYKQIVSSLIEDYNLFHEDLRDVLNQLLIKIERKTMLDLIEKKNISQISFSKHFPIYLKLSTKLYRFEESKTKEYEILSILDGDFVETYVFLNLENHNPKLSSAFKEIDKLRINRNFTKAIDKIEEVIEKYPNSYAFNQYIEILCLKKDVSAALEKAERAIDLNLHPSLFHFYKAEILFIMRKFQKALEAIEVTISKNPNVLYYYVIKVLILISLNSIDEAKDSIRKVYENDKFKLKKEDKEDDIFGYFWLRFIENYFYPKVKNDSKNEPMLMLLNYLIEIAPEDYKLYDQKIDILQFWEPIMFEDLFGTINIRLNLKEDVFYRDLKASLLKKRKQYDEALEVIDSAIGIKPNKSYLYQTKSKILFKLQRFDEAIIEIDSAILNDPEDRAYYRFKTSIYLKMKDYKNALKSIDKTIEQEPDVIWTGAEEEGPEMPMVRYDDEFGEAEIEDDSLDDYVTKADILLKLERKEKALEVLEEVREIAENQNTLDYMKKIDNKIKTL